MSSTNGSNVDGVTATVSFVGTPATDPVTRLRAEIDNGINDHKSPMSSLLVSERRFLYAFLDEIEQTVSDAVKAKEDKSAILDTLLGTVRENLVLEQTVVDQRGTIGDLDRELADVKREYERMVNNAIQSERTVNALTKLSPAEFNAGADSILGLLEITTLVGMRSEDPIAFARQLDQSGAATPSYLRELARRFREMAIAVERANDGVKAR